jgi:lipoprotein-anchoring transpeptidase ErfK/SrfK
MNRQKVLIGALLLALAFFTLGCPKKGEEVTTAAASRGDGKQLLQEADKLFDAGDYPGAQQAYQQVMEQHPGTNSANRAQFRLGQCYLKMEKTDEALAEFRRYVEQNRNDSDLTAAQEYIIRIDENRLQEKVREYETAVSGFEQQNFRLNQLNQSLRRSVDSEVIYLELDLEANRVYVKLGTQTLYVYPVITGKGRTRLKGTGEIKNFNTPTGVRRIEYIEKDPKWYRPDWYWIEKGLPLPANLTMEERGVPDGIYLHGTQAGTIKPGKFSHGCIRLNNADLLQVVRLIEVGTVVYIY